MISIWMKRLQDIGDEYMFGPDLLVAPVIEKGETTKRVYLPIQGILEGCLDQ